MADQAGPEAPGQSGPAQAELRRRGEGLAPADLDAGRHRRLSLALALVLHLQPPLVRRSPQTPRPGLQPGSRR